MNNKNICKGDMLEEYGKKVRKESLFSSILITIIATMLVGFLASFINIPYFWLAAAALTFVAVGYYGLNKVEPGYVGQEKLWGQIKSKYFGHGISWVPRILGAGVDPVDVRVKVKQIPEIEVLDKNDVKTRYKKIRIKTQITDPKANRLNTTEEMVDIGIDSSTEEALREYTSNSTYGQCKKLTSQVEEEIKKNIENKLKEEQDWGFDVNSVEIGSVTADEIVEKEDQEIKAREKRMGQSVRHIKKLKKELPKLTDAQVIKEVKILEGLVKEDISTKVQENKIELGENTSGIIKDVLSLVAKKTGKEKKK